METGTFRTPDGRPVTAVTAAEMRDVAILAPLIRETPVRIPFGFLFVLFLPGYVIVAIFFPEGPRERATRQPSAADTPRGIDGIERLVLSIAGSLVVTMSLALGLHLTGIGVFLRPALATVTLVIAVLLPVAAYRRRRAHPDRRFEPTVRPVIRGVRAEIASFDRIDRVLSVAFVVLLVLVAAGAAYTAAVPGADERYTELYLLTEDRSGNLTATNYPTNLTVGESREVVVSVTNHEFESLTYSVLIQLRDPDGNRTAPAAGAISGIELDHGDSSETPVSVTPPYPGREFQLRFLLYRGAIDPDSPPYRRVYLRVNVSAAS